MASAVPITLLGRDLASCTVYSGVAAPDTGIITWGTGVDIGTAAGNASYKGFAINSNSNGVDVTPSDSIYVTNLTETYSLGFSINQIQKGTGPCTLELAYTNGEYMKIVMAYRKRGSSAGLNYRVAAGRIASVALPHDTGLNVMTVNCDSIGIPEYIGTSIPAVFS